MEKSESGIAQHLIDAQQMTASELRARYKSTYSSWQNMKGRQREGAMIDDRFNKFADFLRHVGPRPSIDHSIDRIESSDREYGPEKVRWADKKGQANNRCTTHFLTVGGQELPLSVWAERTGQKPDTLRDRKAKGWTDREVVHGKAEAPSAGSGNPWHFRPWSRDPAKFAAAEEGYQRDGKRGEHRIQFIIRSIKARLSSKIDYLQDNAHQDENITVDEQDTHARAPARSPVIKARYDSCIEAEQASSIQLKCDALNAEVDALAERLQELLEIYPAWLAALGKVDKPPFWCGPDRFADNEHGRKQVGDY